MAEMILQWLMWAIPSGGIGVAIGWLANRKGREARTAKEVHDVYKEMYTDLGDELLKVRKNNDELTERIDMLSTESERTRRALNRLSRAIEAIQLCPHRDSCPVRDRLSLDTGGDAGAGRDGGGDGKARQRGRGDKGAVARKGEA